ncbi:MAG: type II toxin-antitoxin system VapC family toxin [Phycisphaerae bacterium]|nr:type II toxin-antitoxin system VapC family toxin [Phycisphaerae bacterium]
MIPAFIIDCSVTMAWCFHDEATPLAAAVQDRLIAEAALVPAHWPLEVANVLALAERRKRIAQPRSAEFLAHLAALDIQIDAETAGQALNQTLALCRSQNLTSYDAAYLELAIRRSLPLATLDEDLRAAARKLGVRVLGK